MSNNSESEQADEEMLDLEDQPSFHEAPPDVSMASRSISSRGAKRIPQQWTRIISVDHDAEEDIVAVSIDVDQQLSGGIVEVPNQQGKKNWNPLFISNKFLEDYADLKLEDFVLKD